MKKVIKYIIFIIIFIVIFNMLTLLFVRKGNGYGTDVLNFYSQDRNSIDILFLGSSHAYSAFNPYLLEEETGLNGYNFSTQQQPIWITYYYLKEALKYQQPKYVVLEVHMAIVGNQEYALEQVNRDAIDKMRISTNKINAINSSVEKEDRVYYYFNIMKYHYRYKELNSSDFKTVFLNYSIDNKGYTPLDETDYIFNKNSIKYSDEIDKIYDKNELYLNEIVKLTKENNIKLIFVKTPTIYNEEEYKKLNYLKEYAKGNNILFFDYISNIDCLNLENNDFYDSGHLNKNGSQKFSLEFSWQLNNIIDDENREIK